MFSNEKLSRTALPAQQDMFNPDRWRNIQEVIKTTLVHFHEAIAGMQVRMTQIQTTQKSDRENVVNQLLAITNEQRSLCQKLSAIPITVSEQVHHALTKFQPDIESLQSQQQLVLRELSAKITQDDLSRQLKRAAHHGKKVFKKVPEQELYIESNETMFAMVVEEIKKLKDGQREIAEGIVKKNKTTLALSNEMCGKLESIEKDITGLKLRQEEHRQTHNPKHNQQNKPKTSNHQNQKLQDFYDNLKVNNLSQILSQLQRDLHQKAYLKDIMQLIQNNLAPIEQSIEGMRVYFESNMTSTNKILNHQTIINEQLCREMRLGRWEWSGTVTPKLNMIPWEREMINLYPESLLWTKNTASLVIREPGTYLFQITIIEGGNPLVGLVINKAEVRYSKAERSGFSAIYQDVVRVDKNSSVSVYCEGKEGSGLLVIKRIS